MSQVDKEIWETYKVLKNKIKIASEKGDANLCMQKSAELWMFMNRFRNCDLQHYFDEEIYEWISNLNNKNSEKIFKKLKIKNNYNIAFLVINLNDLGGASIPHRFMLDNFSWEGNSIKNFFLITNFFKKDFKENDSYNYLKDQIKPEKISFLSKSLSHKERGKKIQSWLKINDIDFVVAQICPSTIYALSSNCVPVVANLSQDCYTYTLGPGFGDITYLVTLDQIFKYKFKKTNPNHYSKVIMLPLHSDDQLNNAKKWDLNNLNIPKNGVISGSSNMWKTFFGDGDILLEGIGKLIRKYPFYHHIFIGTKRCLDNLEVFLIKNPDLKKNIHFIGPVKNIYRILKSLDFWVNSFPTSGGSNIEMAKIGKPSIDIAINRNLDLHPAEFLSSNECTVISLDEFIDLGSRFIEDKEYRNDLGNYLKNQVSREFNKERLVSNRIYKELIITYQSKLKNLKKMSSLNIDQTINYEKIISLYNVFGKENWNLEKKKNWLKNAIKKFPSKPFAWLSLIEIIIKNENIKEFNLIVEEIAKENLQDYRIFVYLSIGYLKFNNHDKALETISKFLDLVEFDPIPLKLATKINLNLGNYKEAQRIYKKLKKIESINLEDLKNDSTIQELPIYYNY